MSNINNQITTTNPPILLEDKIANRLKEFIGIKEKLLVEIDYDNINVSVFDENELPLVESLRKEIDDLEIEKTNLEVEIDEYDSTFNITELKAEIERLENELVKLNKKLTEK